MKIKLIISPGIPLAFREASLDLFSICVKQYLECIRQSGPASWRVGKKCVVSCLFRPLIGQSNCSVTANWTGNGSASVRLVRRSYLRNETCTCNLSNKQGRLFRCKYLPNATQFNVCFANVTDGLFFMKNTFFGFL